MYVDIIVPDLRRSKWTPQESWQIYGIFDDQITKSSSGKWLVVHCKWEERDRITDEENSLIIKKFQIMKIIL